MTQYPLILKRIAEPAIPTCVLGIVGSEAKIGKLTSASFTVDPSNTLATADLYGSLDQNTR
jgi:hypothetical protein